MKYLFLSFLILLEVCVLNGCGQSELITYTSYEKINQADSGVETDAGEASQNTAECVYVAVLGGVVEPGIYILPQNVRVYEAINTAGGVCEGGDISGLNLVDVITDDIQIVVPTAGDNSPSQAGLSADGKVNLNTATAEQLTSLNGIGAAKAAAIISYREENGKFTCIEDIMLVPGIKQGTFNAIKDGITVR